jgi:hypothetical protein
MNPAIGSIFSPLHWHLYCCLYPQAGTRRREPHQLRAKALISNPTLGSCHAFSGEGLLFP